MRRPAGGHPPGHRGRYTGGAPSRPGLRLGTQELTRWGMKESDMGVVAELIARVLLRGESPESVARDAAEIARSYPGVAYCGDLEPVTV